MSDYENFEEADRPRSHALLIVLLLILLGVTAFVAWVNFAKPKQFLAWRDATLQKLNIQNPFEVQDELIVDPDKIPDGIRKNDHKICSALDQLGAIVIRDSLTRMGSVVHLNAETNSDETMKLVGKLLYLNAINAVDANVTDAQAAHWESLQHLTSLNVQGNPLTSKSLPSIAAMKEIDGLYLENTQISGEGLSAILELPHVKILNLSGCRLTDADMKVLGQMKSLHWILIQNMNLTDAALPAFLEMPNLKTITIKEGNQISQEAADRFMKDFTEKNGTRIDVN